MSYTKSTLFLMLAAATSLQAQSNSPSCQITAVNPAVRAEGVTERLGDIVFNCTANPNQQVTGNLSIFLNTAVTNRSSATGVLDIAVTANGNLVNVEARTNGPAQIAINGLQLTFPANGILELRISGIRGDASYGGTVQLPVPGGPANLPGTPIVGELAFSPAGLLSFNRALIQIGQPTRGLLYTSRQILVPSQPGSPLPETLNFSGLLSTGTFYASTRFTEGFAASFEPRRPGDENGTRLVLRFSGYPGDARLFVPAAVAGSSATTPTAAGDFGGTVSPGNYTQGSRTLALVRIQSTDDRGAGGFPSNLDFGGITEVPLTNGNGIAVYEIIDSDPQRLESVQVPVFLGLPRSVTSRTGTLQALASFGPQSSASVGGFGNYPRFAVLPPLSDCGFLADCNLYVAKLGAPPTNTTFRLLQGGVANEQFLITNEGGGDLLPFVTSVEYANGAGWIRLDPESSLRARPVRMVVIAAPQMAPGIYRATVIINAGAAGVARYPVTLEVLPRPQGPPPVSTAPRIREVLNGATFEAAPVARNSIYTIKGENLAGNNVQVTFDGRPAAVLFSSATQINFRVPADIGSNTSQVVVSVNGVSSDALTVQVTDAYPGIFNPGILNQDGTVNTPTNPAPAGSVIQIYATGLLGPTGSGVIDARLHDVSIASPAYAGAAPGIPGLQQVNLQIPAYFPTMTTEILLCTTSTGSRICSAPAKVHVRQMQ
ncbi:MAG: hypothetical protein H7039_06770 [Bryobacteraceae bacterium]|nr:hypothetical protein [Bryobacteraceae bacterium]